MKIPVAWLKQYVVLPKTTQVLSDVLTMTGTNVEGFEGSGGTDLLDLEITTNRPANRLAPLPPLERYSEPKIGSAAAKAKGVRRASPAMPISNTT